MKSPPRQTRSMPITETACSRWSIDAVERPPVGPDRDRVQHQRRRGRRRPRARGAGRRRGSAACRGLRGSRRASRGPARRRPARATSAKTPRDSVREVEDDPERDEPVDELAPEAREAAAVLGSAVRERVPPVPREARPSARRARGTRPRATSRPRSTRRPRARASAPGARRHSTASRSAALDTWMTRSAFSAIARWNDATIESASRSDALGLHDDVDVDRADLEADTTLLEQRQPGLREDVRSRRAVARGRRAPSAGRRARPRSCAATISTVSVGRESGSARRAARITPRRSATGGDT